MAHTEQLVILPRPFGLCSLLLQVLGHSWLRGSRAAKPIVYFNRTCLYWSDAGYSDARNAWEYYFEPLSPYRITDVVEADLARLERSSVWEFSSRDPDVHNTPQVNREQIGSIPVRPGAMVSNTFPESAIDWINEMSARRRRGLHETLASMRMRPALTAKIDAFFNQQMRGSHVLGVHIRGSERARERTGFAAGGLLPLTCYLNEIDAYLRRHPSSLILCATDTQWMLDELEERYGSRVVSYPARRLARSEEAIGLHNGLRDDKPQLGEEVLIECALLSRCNFLLHGCSNVSLVATLLNPLLDHVNVYVKHGYLWPRLKNTLGLAPAIRSIRQYSQPFPRRVARRIGRALPAPVRSHVLELYQIRGHLGLRASVSAMLDLLAVWRPPVQTLDYKGFTLWYDRRCIFSAFLRHGRTWEGSLADRIVAELAATPARAFLDIGAHVGMTTLNVLAARPSTRVFAFEPGARQHALLVRTISANHLERQVTCHQVALGDRTGTQVFTDHGPRYDVFDGLLDTGRAPLLSTTTVQQDTLDNWWRAADNPQVGVIKIDTEGAELWILSGASELLGRDRPTIFLEMHPTNLRPYPYQAGDIVRWLHTRAYRVEGLDGTAIDETNLDQRLAAGIENFMARPSSPGGRS